MGFSDAPPRQAVRPFRRRGVTKRRHALDVRPLFKRIDTCAAEFASPTAYMYSTYETPFAGVAANEAAPSDKKKVVILGGGPNRIGQGIEFDYCCMPRLLCVERSRLRNQYDQLQSGDGVDRLRHLGPLYFETAHLGRCAGNHRHRALERHAAWRHPCSSAARRR